jgi:hypothetical protein
MKLHKHIVVVLTLGMVTVNTRLLADDQQTPPLTGQAGAPGTPGVAAATHDDVPQGGIEVVRMVLCRDVKDRDPDQEITTAKVGDTVVGWTQIRSGLGEVTVTHRWLHETENLGDVPLSVKSSPWRTWSRKTLSEPGNWKWQVLNSQGAVLKEVAFAVTP